MPERGRREIASVPGIEVRRLLDLDVEKRDLMSTMSSEADLNQQQRLKCAFDDKGLLNPGKVFPTLHRCAELGRMHVHAGRVAFPDIPRF
jgi:glycolate oxidase